MIQIKPASSSSLATSGTDFLPVPGHQYKNTTENLIETIVSSAGTISKLRIKLSAAPGAGTSRTFTVRKNGADTAVTLTISDAATTGVDASNSFTVAAGDRISISSTVSGTPAAAIAKYVLNYTGDTSKESLILGNSRNIQLSTSAAQYKSIEGVVINSGVSTTEGNHRVVIPTGGAIKKLYVNLLTAPGVGTSRTFTLVLNGTPSALTVTISDAATTGSDTSNSVTVSAGDEVTLLCDISGSPAASEVRHGMVFLADTDGEALLLGNFGATNPGESNEKFTTFNGGIGADATESNGQQLVNACTLKKIFVEVSTSYTGNSTYDVRVNDASPASNPSATITGGGTAANETSNTATAADGDTIDLRVQRASDTDIKRTGWGLVIVATVPPDDINISVFDSVTVTEAVTMMVDENINLNDTVTVTDVPQVDTSYEPIVFDAVTVSEEVTLEVVSGPSGDDLVTITESVTIHILELVPSVYEDVTVTDEDTEDSDMSISVVEDVTITESISAESPVDLPAVSDNVAVTESVSVMVDLNPAPFDAVTITEAGGATGLLFIADPRRELIHMRSTEQSYPIMLETDEVA